MKKVAVFIKGNLRVWNYTKENIFAFCDSLGEQVDYYVALWYVQKSHNRIAVTSEDFKGRTLKCFKMLDSHWNYNAWEGPAYLSSLLNIEKINEELWSNVQYDAVLDTRPDVVFNKLTDVTAPEPWSVGTTKLELEPVGTWQGLEDHVFFTDSPTSTLFAGRQHYGNHPGVDGHHKLLKYCNMTNLKPFKTTQFECKIVRPTICDQYLSVPPNIDMQVPIKASIAWEKLGIPERLEYLKKTTIGIDEYMSGLNLAY
jgi:hypothetical protein